MSQGFISLQYVAECMLQHSDVPWIGLMHSSTELADCESEIRSCGDGDVDESTDNTCEVRVEIHIEVAVLRCT